MCVIFKGIVTSNDQSDWLSRSFHSLRTIFPENTSCIPIDYFLTSWQCREHETHAHRSDAHWARCGSGVRWPRQCSEYFRAVSQDASSDDGKYSLSSIDVTRLLFCSEIIWNMSAGDRSRAVALCRRRRCVSTKCTIVWGRTETNKKKDEEKAERKNG